MILCFSGTGNSRHAARLLADMLGEPVASINEFLKAGKAANLLSETPYVVVAPVYAWRMPRIVSAFLEGARVTKGRKVYFVLTCGDGMGGAGDYARTLAEKMGLKYMGTASVVMPENYVAVFGAPGPDAAQEIIRRAEPAIRAIGEQIRRGVALPEARGTIFKKVASDPLNGMFYAFVVGAKRFRATEKCVGCGWCARTCPTNNIELREGRPVWGSKCTHCMACIGGCPEKAIEYGRRTVGKNRYYME